MYRQKTWCQKLCQIFQAKDVELKLSDQCYIMMFDSAWNQYTKELIYRTFLYKNQSSLKLLFLS